MPNPIAKWLASKTAQLIVAAIIGAIVLGFINQILSWRDGSIANDANVRKMGATQGIQKDGDSSTKARQEADVGIARARANFENVIGEDREKEPETVIRDDGAVPASRLRAFKERRLERERIAADRLRRAGIERKERSSSEDTSER